MQSDLVNIGLGFLEGFALIISPCILPILPIILSGSLTGSKKRPFGIICGFIIIFAIVTFLSRKLVQTSGIDLNLIRYASYGLLMVLGVVMLSTTLTEKFAEWTQGLTSAGSSLSSVNNPEGGWWSGVLFGGLIAVIWTPCAGPILAAVIVQTVIQESNLMSFLTLLAFAIGAAVPMLVIALFGREILAKFGYLKTHTSAFRKILGVIIIASVVYMIEVERVGAAVATNQNHSQSGAALEHGLAHPYPAPEIGGIEAWINSNPLKIADLKGKVVLIDFWTYSCINCIRTLPYLKDWYQKYHDQGFKIIGVHTPEFDFEKSFSNVKNAVINDGLHYPVALDNQFVTWRHFNNQFWPGHYLIDKNGQVVYTHFGEGDYDITENNIRYLLGLSASDATQKIPVEKIAPNQTPETYLGYERADSYAGVEAPVKDQIARYSFPKKLHNDNWALQGQWKILRDRIVSQEIGAAIEINFNARRVFIVMGNTSDQPIDVKLILNGTEITNRPLQVDKHQLYDAVDQVMVENGILKVIATSPGLEIYTFTFGG